MTLRLAILIACVASLGGCMILDLDGDLAPAPCGSDSDCAHLDDGRPPNPCESHRCLDDALCHRAIADADHDGSPSAVCSGSDTDDCDDANASVGPGALETSNGRDDDCDGVVDEVTMDDLGETVRYLSLGELRASRPTRGPGNDDGCVTFVDRDGEDAGATRLLDIDDGIAAVGIVRSTASGEVPLFAHELASDRVATDKLVVATVPSGDCQRVVVGLAVESTTAPPRAVTRFVDNSGTHFSRGLADADGVDCMGGNASTVHAARSPAVATQGADGVAVWLTADAALASCAPVANVPVVAHRFSVASDTVGGTNGKGTLLGVTDDASAPALISVPGYGMVAAFVDDAALVVVRVTMAPSAALDTTVLLRTPMLPEASIHRPAIALGPTVDGSPTIGVVVSVGDCELGEPVFARVLLAGSSTDASPTHLLGEPVRLGRGGDEAPHDRDHAIVYSDAPRGYWTAWIDGGQLRVRHLLDDGTPLGPSPRVVTSSRVTTFDSIGLLGPVPGQAASLTMVATAVLVTGESVVLERKFVFP